MDVKRIVYDKCYICVSVWLVIVHIIHACVALQMHICTWFDAMHVIESAV